MVDEEDLYTIKINCKGKSRKGKQRNKCRKNIIGLKKLKLKKGRRRRKKENSTELQKPNVEAEVYNNNKKCD